MNLFDRLLPATGTRGRTYKVWQEMEDRVAGMDDQDALIADLVRQRDEALRMAAAATAQVEEFRARVTDAEAEAARAQGDAEQAHAEVVELRSQLANAQAITVPMYAPDSPTQELLLPLVVSLMARGAA